MPKSTICLRDSVSIIAHVDATQRAISASVASIEPFLAESTDECCRHLTAGTRVILLHRRDNHFTKAEATVLGCLFEGDKRRLEFHGFQWEQLDRRRYPRFDSRLPVRVRLADERENVVEILSVESTTQNISLGGAWIEGSPAHDPGSLVEAEVRLPSGEVVRTFGVVAWASSEEGGFGVEFLDFVGASRYYLQEHLSRAA